MKLESPTASCALLVLLAACGSEPAPGGPAAEAAQQAAASEPAVQVPPPLRLLEAAEMASLEPYEGVPEVELEEPDGDGATYYGAGSTVPAAGGAAPASPGGGPVTGRGPAAYVPPPAAGGAAAPAAPERAVPSGPSPVHFEAGAGEDDPERRVETWRRAGARAGASSLRVGEDEELPLLGLQASVWVEGFRARVVLDCIYFNDREQLLEGDFRLLPPKAK